MYRVETTDLLKNRFIALWSLLAFQAGFINSFGFLAAQRFVSHITGFGTQVGTFLGSGDYLLAVEMLTVPVAFIAGAWLSGQMTVARFAHGKKPRYDLVTMLIPMLLVLIMTAGHYGFFGEFGEPLLLARDFELLGALSFVCGIQNACFTTLTKGQIRTTHLTGISTDLGTDLSLIQSGKLPPEEHVIAVKRNILRGATLLSFSVGAIISVLVDARLQHLALTIPIATATVVALVFFVQKRRIDARGV